MVRAFTPLALDDFLLRRLAESSNFLTFLVGGGGGAGGGGAGGIFGFPRHIINYSIFIILFVCSSLLEIRNRITERCPL